jgi:integral membrane protein
VLATPIGRLRVVAFVEGISFLLLLFVAMPLKYAAGIPEAVRVVGMAHGVLFVAFAAALAHAALAGRWKPARAAWAFASAVVPFGTFVLDAHLRREQARSGAGAQVAAALAAVVLLGACDGPADGREQYVLASVNGSELPAAYPDPLLPAGSVMVGAGALTLREGGRLEGSWTMACPEPPPQGTTCEIDGDGRQRFEGSYSREDGTVTIGERQYQATFHANGIEVVVQLPAYTGYWPVYRLRYAR